jgi:DNA-directed RNA polymerase subunit M/transcription elongation factor TFIIS
MDSFVKRVEVELEKKKWLTQEKKSVLATIKDLASKKQNKEMWFFVLTSLKNMDFSIFQNILAQLEMNGYEGVVEYVFSNVKKDMEHEVNSIIKPPRVFTGEFKCGKCHTNRTWYYQVQTSRGDEGMTTFINCACGNKWKTR